MVRREEGIYGGVQIVWYKRNRTNAMKPQSDMDLGALTSDHATLTANFLLK